MVRPPLVLLLLAIGAAPVVRAQDRPRETGSIDGRRRQAIKRGLRYLARNQNRDGSFGEQEAGKVGITALSLLAFMAQGHQEGRGEYASFRSERAGTGDVLARGVNYLMRCSLPPGRNKLWSDKAQGKPSGYIWVSTDADSRMHGHGYATQALVLAYGMLDPKTARAEELKEIIKRAVRVIENSQTNTGGWGYQPNHATTHEGSITVTVVQALRLAADAGFVVDKETQRRGLQYLHDSQKRDGSFKYSLMSDNSTAALTAAALTAMHGFGEYYSKAVRNGIDYLRQSFRTSYRVQWPFYGRYYAAQAFYRAGGAHWQAWRTSNVPQIILEQRPGGYWEEHHSGPRAHGRAYATAFSCLALSVEDGYLPLFQR